MKTPFIHEKECLFFHVLHDRINYLRNDFWAINRALRCGKTLYQHPDMSTLARELPARRIVIRSERPRVN